MKALRCGMPAYERIFIAALAQQGIEQPEQEFVFASPRRWRFDYAWPDRKIALEVEGGVWIKGRHNSPTGFLKDMEKYNEATALGWRVLRCTPAELRALTPVKLIARVILNG